MTKKRSNLLKDKKLLEHKIADGLTNLEDYTSALSENIDFNSFDILSITRTDSEQPYTCQYAHRKLDTQVYRIITDALKAVPFRLFKLKIN